MNVLPVLPDSGEDNGNLMFRFLIIPGLTRLLFVRCSRDLGAMLCNMALVGNADVGRTCSPQKPGYTGENAGSIPVQGICRGAK